MFWHCANIKLLRLTWYVLLLQQGSGPSLYLHARLLSFIYQSVINSLFLDLAIASCPYEYMVLLNTMFFAAAKSISII